MWVRFRALKQDTRQERPAAPGSGDWACLGDVPDTKWSPIKWYVRLAQLHGVARDPRSPMFVDKSDVKRPLLYRVARQCNHCNRKPETKPLEPMQCTPVT